MKSISILFLFFFTSFLNILQAQDIELRWGLPVKHSRVASPTDVLGKDGTGFYIIKADGDISLEKFDKNMNFLWTKKLDIYLTKKDKTVFENLILINNKIVVFKKIYSFFFIKAFIVVISFKMG